MSLKGFGETQSDGLSPGDSAASVGKQGGQASQLKTFIMNRMLSPLPMKSFS
jgi:hypothetical protein